MLAIRPISTNYVQKTPMFKGSKDDLKQEREYLENTQRDIEDVINDVHVPEKIKKPFKFFRVLTMGALDGIAVFGSVLMLVGSFKKLSAKVSSSKFADKAAKVAKPLGEKISKGAKFITELASEGLEYLSTTKFGKKAIELYGKFAKSAVGKKVIAGAKFIGKKVSDAYKAVAKYFKGVKGENVTKGVAGGLGVGSGITGAYEEAMAKNPVVEDDEFIMEGDE